MNIRTGTTRSTPTSCRCSPTPSPICRTPRPPGRDGDRHREQRRPLSPSGGRGRFRRVAPVSRDASRSPVDTTRRVQLTRRVAPGGRYASSVAASDASYLRADVPVCRMPVENERGPIALEDAHISRAEGDRGLAYRDRLLRLLASRARSRVRERALDLESARLRLLRRADILDSSLQLGCPIDGGGGPNIP